jgi:hypothetical protein
MNTDEDIGKNIGGFEKEERDRVGQERGGRGLFRIFWVFVVVIVVYVLSSGPVVRLSHRSTIARRLLVIYEPLASLAVHSRPASRFLEWYIGDVWHTSAGD